MKLKTFLSSGILAAGAVLLYQNKENINDTKETVTGAQYNLANIKSNLKNIQDQKEQLSEMTSDLTYKFRVFNAELQAHLSEIKKVTQKYQDHHASE